MKLLPAAGAALGAALVVFLVLPLLALFLTSGPAAFWEGLHHPITAPALGLSLASTT